MAQEHQQYIEAEIDSHDSVLTCIQEFIPFNQAPQSIHLEARQIGALLALNYVLESRGRARLRALTYLQPHIRTIWSAFRDEAQKRILMGERPLLEEMDIIKRKELTYQ